MNKTENNYVLRFAKRLRAIESLGGKCSECGNDNIFHLAFHHLDSDVKEDSRDTISNAIVKMVRWDVIESKLESCIILCHNCHSELHFREGRGASLKRDVLSQLGVFRCIRCDYQGKNFASLVFHHRGDKDFLIGDFTSRKISVTVQELIDELNKCDVLCKNCHQLNHKDVDKFEGFKDAIYARLKSHKGYKRIDRKKIVEMHESGRGICSISREMGYAKSTVSVVIKRYKEGCLSGRKGTTGNRLMG